MCLNQLRYSPVLTFDVRVFKPPLLNISNVSSELTDMISFITARVLLCHLDTVGLSVYSAISFLISAEVLLKTQDAYLEGIAFAHYQ